MRIKRKGTPALALPVAPIHSPSPAMQGKETSSILLAQDECLNWRRREFLSGLLPLLAGEGGDGGNARFVLAAIVFALPLQITFAQSYPSKPIRLVLPVAPGGGSDIIVRVVTQKVAASINQQFVIDYRGGANGNIAHDLVAKAPADGYTLLWVNAGFATNPGMYKKLNHDPVKDFAPITQLTSQSYVFVVHPSVPVKTVKEFIALSTARKG